MDPSEVVLHEVYRTGWSPDAKLVTQGKSLEQEVSTRRPSRSDRSTRPDDGSHRFVECRPATPTPMDFWPDAILGGTHEAPHRCGFKWEFGCGRAAGGT